MTGDLQTAAIMSAGMKVLRETLGLIETEIFIANIKNPGLDYTKWREHLWEDISLQDLLALATTAEEKYGIPARVQVR